MTKTGNADEPQFLNVGTGVEQRRIAIRIRPARDDVFGPTLVWLGGYHSNMSGTKALEVDKLAERLGLAAVRFDYSGHGLSGGKFTNGTISRWLSEALSVLDHAGPRRVILIGSSMGAWIALRLVKTLQDRPDAIGVDGLVLIAPAPDFTSDLIEPNLSEVQKTALATQGYFTEASSYSTEPNIFTRALIEDGRVNRVLDGLIETGCPVHILQGMQDADVPYSHALKLMEHLPAEDVVLTLVRDGDHRLSRPQDIERMLTAVAALAGEVTPSA